jgi:hypothetical protein
VFEYAPGFTAPSGRGLPISRITRTAQADKEMNRESDETRQQ